MSYDIPLVMYSHQPQDTLSLGRLPRRKPRNWVSRTTYTLLALKGGIERRVASPACFGQSCNHRRTETTPLARTGCRWLQLSIIMVWRRSGRGVFKFPNKLSAPSCSSASVGPERQVGRHQML